MVEGVRELKKRETRRRIAETALRLFAVHGFDVVTVAEVAKAAGVTEKTVFNHFETKEDLVYSEDRAFEAELLESVRTRPAGEPALAAAGRFLLGRYRRLTIDPASGERARMFATLVASSPALRTRERRIHSRYADALCALIAEEQRAGAGDLRPRLLAEALMAVHRESLAMMRAGLLEGTPVDELGPRAVTAARRGLALLADGFAGYAADRPGDASASSS
ncbi:TetR family transcriptional regulator [Nonomuraea mesophila]|uniref:TetR family transcriptional regulator n=1 Tax=Nonomuraea mesophila TaxID=2530382 RepID=A0A4R5FAJ0_9ACTN|nr:TetR/AcrR family transcriptional regulator [Nonomuraea mesophila]TDE45312.1 TetR family transcriptional regulator [Nonomuraea mesophila]